MSTYTWVRGCVVSDNLETGHRNETERNVTLSLSLQRKPLYRKSNNDHRGKETRSRSKMPFKSLLSSQRQGL